MKSLYDNHLMVEALRLPLTPLAVLHLLRAAPGQIKTMRARVFPSRLRRQPSTPFLIDVMETHELT
jgi:hypothetical protein